MKAKKINKKSNFYVNRVLLHVLIGIILFLFEPLSKIYFFTALIYFSGRIILLPDSKKTEEILLACAYFTGAEVLFRMTKGGVAYESSKYLVTLFMVIGMFFKGISGKGYPYFIYLIALLPSVIVASMTLSLDANFRTNIAFVLSGPVCLGIAALFCFDRKVSHTNLLKCITNILYPTISMTVYLFLYNPSIKDTLSGTASNAATSGGFGPNQVSTALGLGIIAVVIRLFMKSPSIGLKVLNLILLMAILFRAIVTFSRGGVFAAIIVIIAFLGSLFYRSSAKHKNQIGVSLIMFFIAASVTWAISSNQTEGLIDKRYANQNAAGIEKEDISTGRLGLFIEEINGFINSPFLGIGASRVKDSRVELYGTELPSHNEIGRLLSEHGFIGVIIILILFIKPLVYRANNKNNFYFYAFFCFWFATINHSGMRIAAPAFLYALCLLNITNEKNPVHRKQITK